MEVTFQKPREGEAAVKYSILLKKKCFIFLVSCFPAKSVHLCLTNSNLIIVHYFPCTWKSWSYNLFSNHRSGKKSILFLQQLSFLEQEDQRHTIISFILPGSEAQKSILQRLRHLFCSVKEKTLSSCFHAKSFDNKKEYTGKITPTEKSFFAHLLIVDSKRYKEAVNNFQLWIKT